MNAGTIAAVVLALAGTARAASLDYNVPTSCPTKARFADEVSAKLGFSPWNYGGRTVQVRIDVREGQFVGTLSSAADRERHFTADSCRKVSDLLVTAVAITLDRADRAKPAAVATASTTVTASATPNLDDPVPLTPMARENLRTWSFAPRNNLYQLGLGYVSTTGPAVTGNIPLGPGHVQASLAYMSNSDSFVASSTYEIDAFYLYPIFYLNKSSAFEVPIFAGGGLGLQHYEMSQPMGGMGKTDSALLPTGVIGNAIQFNGFPIEFMFQMTLSLTEPANAASRFGVDLGIRYVFGRSQTRDVVRYRDL